MQRKALTKREQTGINSRLRAAISINGEIVGQLSLDIRLKQGFAYSPLSLNIFFSAIIDVWQARLLGKGISLIFNINGNLSSVNTLKRKTNVNKEELSKNVNINANKKSCRDGMWTSIPTYSMRQQQFYIYGMISRKRSVFHLIIYTKLCLLSSY